MSNFQCADGVRTTRNYQKLLLANVRGFAGNTQQAATTFNYRNPAKRILKDS
jgi:hypothetical protein